MTTFHIPLLHGSMTSAGLIMAIGAQNAFVLKQGILRHQIFMTAFFCFLCDSLLIVLGVYGLGSMLAQNESLLLAAKWGGGLFLFWYGLRSFRAAFTTTALTIEDHPDRPSWLETMMNLVAFTFLNPHVYLDTVVLLGGIGAQLPQVEQPFFILGAMISSFVWFFGLCYGARILAPIFSKPLAWKVLDVLIGCMMWIMAWVLMSGI